MEEVREKEKKMEEQKGRSKYKKRWKCGGRR